MRKEDRGSCPYQAIATPHCLQPRSGIQGYRVVARGPANSNDHPAHHPETLAAKVLGQDVGGVRLVGVLLRGVLGNAADLSRFCERKRHIGSASDYETHSPSVVTVFPNPDNVTNGCSNRRPSKRSNAAVPTWIDNHTSALQVDPSSALASLIVFGKPRWQSRQFFSIFRAKHSDSCRLVL